MAPLAETPIMPIYGNYPIEVSKELDLVDGWWTSESFHLLERRAIFSKTWICIAHRSRFTKPGDYISLELAGFPILMILGKDHIARGFHNVCRHRAYTITKKPSGSSLVLGCRYHGWSYDTRGNLVKAPQFEGVEGFNKLENGLFKIRTCTDRGGFIHINLDTSQFGNIPDCEHTVEFSSHQGISPSSKWLTGWEINGAFNWKTIGASDRTGIGTPSTNSSSVSWMTYLVSMFRRAGVQVDVGQYLRVSPSTIILTFPELQVWALLIALPTSATQSLIKCDVFSISTKTSLGEASMEAMKTYIEYYVRTLEQRYDAFRSSLLAQEPSLLSLVKEHLKLERVAGSEIFPTRKEHGWSESFCKAEKICKELDAMAKAGNGRGHAIGSVRVDSTQGSLEW